MNRKLNLLLLVIVPLMMILITTKLFTNIDYKEILVIIGGYYIGYYCMNLILTKTVIGKRVEKIFRKIPIRITAFLLPLILVFMNYYHLSHFFLSSYWGIASAIFKYAELINQNRT